MGNPRRSERPEWPISSSYHNSSAPASNREHSPLPVFKSTRRRWVRSLDSSKLDETAKPLLDSTASAASTAVGAADRLAIPPFLRRVSP